MLIWPTLNIKEIVQTAWLYIEITVDPLYTDQLLLVHT